MATKPPRKKPPAKKKPPAQAERFAEAVRALEAAGELSLEEASERFERAIGTVLTPKRPVKLAKNK